MNKIDKVPVLMVYSLRGREDKQKINKQARKWTKYLQIMNVLAGNK